jgi:hypothetical protein
MLDPGDLLSPDKGVPGLADPGRLKIERYLVDSADFCQSFNWSALPSL